MSAVSKKSIPASSAASTTAVVAAWSMRPPKLLQPMPTTLTSSEPMRRVSMRLSLRGVEALAQEDLYGNNAFSIVDVEHDRFVGTQSRAVECDGLAQFCAHPTFAIAPHARHLELVVAQARQRCREKLAVGRRATKVVEVRTAPLHVGSERRHQRLPVVI